ncbi:hypothetical protein DINM_000052 [Dirofilaria immitis]|nr:hypothetical protein [Dirofilaria immitis]
MEIMFTITSRHFGTVKLPYYEILWRSDNARYPQKVRDVATTQNREAVVNACGRAVTAVEVINASKLRNFTKCDDSFTFTLYVDKPKDGTYYVVYLPRALKIWYTRLRKDGELLRDQLNNLKLLVNILENENSKSNDFAAKLEQLRDSVIKNPSFDDIHHAAACNFSTIIIALCNNRPSLGAHTAKQDCHSRSAVHYSAENPEILRLLSEAHDFADAIDMIDEDGLSPLCLAICSANIKCVELLLDANCSTGPFPGGSLAALVAVANSSSDLLKIVDLLLIRVPQFLVEEVNGSSTILHEKLEPKLLHHILGDLVDVVNINVRNGLNETPLHCAVARNDLSQSFALLTYNADVNIANGDGDTPLHMSVKNGSIQLVKLLLCFGASVQLKNDNEETALDVGRNNPEIMECLRLFVHSPLDVRSVSNDALFDLMQDRALEKRHQMTSKERQQLVNVISFDGGGIRGLILLQILLHIEKLLGHSVMKHFQWLCGTSTGAIIALGLAKVRPRNRQQNKYHERNLQRSLKTKFTKGVKPLRWKIILGTRVVRDKYGHGPIAKSTGREDCQEL